MIARLHPPRMTNVFRGSLPSLLVDQVEIAERRLLVCVQFKKRSLGDKFIGCRDGIVAGAGNLSRSIFCELVLANLKQTNIRPGALLWVKIGFDLGNGSH